MNIAEVRAPYVHTKIKPSFKALDWAVALIPLIIWSIYMFGARAAMIYGLSAVFALLLDYPVQRFVFKLENGVRCDIMTAVYAVLAAFMMPVSVPLWIPAVSASAVVLAKNLRVFRGRRLFNPFVFSAAVLNLAFPSIMTAFTRPMAYFSAFDITIDPILLERYRVISPLQYIADGSVYEDGIWAQLYGFASGNMGEIAVAAIIIASIRMFFRKEADYTATLTFLIVIFLFALAMPSADAQSEHYAYSILLSGGIFFLSLFALNESATVPMTASGRFIFAAVCGCLVFLTRKYFGGTEWGYLIILAMNAVSPFIEAFTKPKTI